MAADYGYVNERTQCCAVAHAGGAVMGLTANSKQGVIYTVCSQTGSLEVWQELFLHPVSCNTTPSPASASAFAICTSESLVATAHKDLKIRLWRTQCPSLPALRTTSILPSLRQYLHNWTLQRRYVKTRRHGKKRAWMQHSDTISALAFSADCTRLYSASWDRTVKVWNIAHMRCEESFAAHNDSINAMVVGARDGLLYTGSADKSIKVWSQRRGCSNNKESKHALVVSMQRKQGAAVNALAMSRDCLQLYSGESDGQIVVWRRSAPCWPHKAAPAQLMQVQETVQAHGGRAVLCLAMHPDESLLVSGSADKTIRVWSSPASTDLQMVCLAVLRGHSAPIRSLAFSGEGMQNASGSCEQLGAVYSGSLDGCIKRWMLVTADLQESNARRARPVQPLHRVQHKAI